MHYVCSFHLLLERAAGSGGQIELRLHRSSDREAKVSWTGIERALHAKLIEKDGDITTPELGIALLDATGIRAHPNAIGKFFHNLI